MKETIVMQNPIGARARGWIYATNIIVAGLGIIATAALTIMQLIEWLPLVVAIGAATSITAGSLARANLTILPTDPEVTGVEF